MRLALLALCAAMVVVLLAGRGARVDAQQPAQVPAVEAGANPQGLAAVEPSGTPSTRTADSREAAGTPVAEPARRVTLPVNTYRRDRRRSVPVPDIAVRAGVAWLGAEHPDQSGELPDGSGCLHRVALAEGVTDAEGELVLELGLTEALLSAELVWVEVIQAGYQRRIGKGALPPEGNPDAVRVLAQAGWTVRGRVLDQGGAPVARAQAAALFVNAEGQEGTPYVSASTGPRGVFELQGKSSWERVNVYGRHPGIGAGRVAGIAPLERDPDELIVVNLEGAGVLAGTLVDPGGTPIVGYGLLALPAKEHGRKSSLNWRGLPKREREGGLCEGRVITGESGEFRFAGLQAGEYELKLTPSGDAGYKLRVTDGPVPTGREDLALVAPLHRVRVRLREHDPEQAVSELLSADRAPYLFEQDVAIVYASTGNGKGGVISDDEAAKGPRVTKEDGREFALKPGSSYVFGAFSRQHAPVERELFVGDTAWFTELVLDLGAPRARGTLGVRLHAPGVSPPGRFKPSVTVRSLTGGRRLFSRTEWRDADQELVLDLPAGLFRVAARDQASLSSTFLTVEEQLLVPSAGHVSWEAALRPTGQVEVRVELAGGTPADPGAGPGPEGPGPEGFGLEGVGLVRLRDLYSRDETGRRRAGGVRVVGFDQPSGARRYLWFPPQPIPGGRSGRARTDTWVVPGRDVLAGGRFAVGEFLIVAEREGYHPAEVTAWIEQDRVARVVLRLEPR